MHRRSIVCHSLCAWCWGLAAVAPAGAGAGTALRWTYEAVGPDEPKREQFLVRPEAVEWLDEQGRVLWRLERAGKTLIRLDPQQGTRQVMDEAAMAGIAADLARAHALGLGAAAGPGRPPRPWAAVEAADRWTPLQGEVELQGTPCRRVALHAGVRTVGEACLADAQALPGGTALLQLLQRLAGLADEVKHRLGKDGPADWPLHPLVAAARSGALPLSVRESLPGERSHEWRLASRPSADLVR